jgi:hypothetical protein
MSPRTVNAGNGWQWIVDGFHLFTKNPGMWVLLTLVLMVSMVVIGLIPVLGSIACAVLWPVLAAGLLLGCKALDNGQPLELPHLYAGFESGDRLPQLLIVGAAYLLAMIIIFAIAFAAIGVPVVHSLKTGGAPGAGGVLAMIGSMFVGVLIAMGLMVPVAMAIWFAPTLVLFENMRAVDAMKQSFAACLRNIVPFLIYGLVAFFASIVAAIPFGLGYLVLLPVLVCSLYMSHKDVFATPADDTTVPAAAGNPLLR